MPRLDWSDLDKQVDAELVRLLDRGERRILDEYRIAYKAIREDMAVLYEKYANGEGELTYAEMTKYNRLTTLEKNIAAIMNQQNRIVIRDFAALSEEAYEASFFRYAWAFDQNARVAITWGSLSPEAIKAITQNPLDLISHGEIPLITRDRINRAITQGLIQGKSYPQMMKQIQAAMANNAYQAMRIARTEGQRAMSEGTEEIYDRARRRGIAGGEIWDATLDGRTRRSHQLLDGVPRPENGLWRVVHIAKDNPSGIVETTGPLMSGVASFDIHCRCRRRFEVEGYSPTLRRTRDEGVIPYETYPAWEERRRKGNAIRPSDFKR